MIEQLNYTETKAPDTIETLIIFIHGYGANGKDLLQLAPYFQKHYKNCHFVAPNAPYATDYPDSYYWFPINNFNEDHLKEGVENSVPVINKFINYCKKQYKLSNQQIILFGFSQGSLLSIYYGLKQPEKFKAILAFSGGALSDINSIIKNKTPICLVHGLQDEILSPEHSLSTAENLTKEKHPNELKLIDNLGHSINLAGLEFAVDFLAKH